MTFYSAYDKNTRDNIRYFMFYIRSSSYVALLALMELVFAAPPANSAGVLKPSMDDFYQPPPGFESAELGTVLKMRQTPHQLRSIYIPLNVKNSWQLLVRSSSAQGNATAVVTTLIEPFNANSTRLVSYQIAEDAANVDCAASYSFQFGAAFTETVVAQAEMFLLQIALDAGCWVSAPDYEGHSASFTAGRTSGKSTLDTIKGVLSVANKTGLNAEADVILWGYSGGSIASGWAAAMQPWYSPDLKPRLKGVAIGGFAANITKTVLGVDGTFYAGMIPAGMTGLGNEYPIIREYIDKILPQDRRNYFNFVGKQCLAPACIYYLYTNIFKGVNPIVQSGYDVLYEPPVAAILRNTTLGVSKVDMPQIPVFIFHGEKDTIVPFKNTLDVYDSWCDWGIESLEVSSSQTTRHITEAIIGLPAAFTWIMNTFNGVPTVKGCLKTSRFNNLLYPGVDTGIVDLLTSAAKSIFGIELGPDTLKRGQDIDYDAILENYLHALYKKS